MRSYQRSNVIKLPDLVPRLGGSERNSQREKLAKGAGKVLEEQGLVLGIFRNPLFEFRVGQEDHVRWQHCKDGVVEFERIVSQSVMGTQNA